MPACEVKGCNNRTWNKSEEQVKLEETQHITFHLFPKDAAKRKLWADIVGVDEDVLHSRSVLCSLHFKSDDFDRSLTSFVKLKPTAVPYMPLNPDTPSDNNQSEHGLQDQIPQIKRLSDNKREHRAEDIATVSTSNTRPQSSDEDYTKSYLYRLLTGLETRKRPSESGPSEEEVSPTKKPQNLGVQNLMSGTTTVAECFAIPQVPKAPVDKTTQVSPARTLHSPKKQYLRKIIRKMKKARQRELRLLNEKRSRGIKRIATLGEVIKSLREKNLVASEQLDVLSNIGPSGVEFLKRVINRNTGQPAANEYPNELKSFALTLHYFSPRAYGHVREKFTSRLPHPKSLTKWYQSGNGEPGFSTVALGYIKSRANSATQALIGALILDEISLRQSVNYDGCCFRGFVNVGSDIATDNVTLAKSALVLLVVGVNQSWQIPIGYFLVDSINGEQRCNIVRQSLMLLHDNGLRVISITCDGGPSNLAMVKELQCNLSNPTALKMSFHHPLTNENVHVLFDPCHMLKLVRNTLGDWKYLVNAKQQRIEWSYIEELEITRETGYLLKNRSKGPISARVYCDKENMKISLVAQTFSFSTGTAINLCRTRLLLSQFENSEATEEFVQLFDGLFDIFTSRNLRQRNFKYPINRNNRVEILAKLSEAEDYILGLVGPTGKPLVSSERKTGFLGFLASIESLRSIHSELFSDDKTLEYLPMYKLSQAPAQLFFGCIRALESQNKSPDVRQFTRAFVRILARAESKGVATGNSMSIQDIPIVSASSYTDNPQLIIIHSTSSYKFEEKNSSERLKNACEVNEEAYALSLVKSLGISEFSYTAIVYIASFIVKRLSESLNCGKCILALSRDQDSRRTDCYLITTRDRGKLYYPSNSVIAIFQTAQRVIRYLVAKSGEFCVTKKYSERRVCSLILSELNEKKLFLNLIAHSNDQCGLDNHRLQLTRCVIVEYVKNVAFNGRESINFSESERHYLNKMILFKGV